MILQQKQTLVLHGYHYLRKRHSNLIDNLKKKNGSGFEATLLLSIPYASSKGETLTTEQAEIAHNWANIYEKKSWLSTTNNRISS